MANKSATHGHLIMAANSLGLATDIPQRSLDALRNSDVLVFEEDRPARAALKAAGIHRDYLKLNEHNSSETLEILRKALKNKKTVCYMSDQGMPNVADPGQQLNKYAQQIGCRQTVIPGPCSVTTALAAFPEPYREFHYAGFLPRDQVGREKKLKQLSELKIPVVILDAPYRRHALVDAMQEACDPIKTKVLLAIDISGEHERYIYDSIEKLKLINDKLQGKLNFVAILRG